MTTDRPSRAVKILDAAGKDISCETAVESELRAALDRLEAAGWKRGEIATAAIELVNSWYLARP
jgi:hypothetical protein